MQLEFLATLHCPYSGSALSLSQIAREHDGQIHYGIVSSEAGDFPIVEGILRLHIDEYREPIVEHVREKRFSQALTMALDEVPSHGRAGVAIKFASGLAFRAGFKITGERLNRLKRHFTRIVTDNETSFVGIAEKLTPDASAGWQKYRFSMPTFLPVYPLLHVLREHRSVLDFGCGTGQASFLISRMWPNSSRVCADYSFCSLYLAKKYFVPDASFVCLDGDYLLPFGSGQFSTVFSSDALHCIDSKLSLAQEFLRVSCEKAVTILPHLHNRLAWPYAKSLTPNGYRDLFKHMEARVIPEQEIIRDYFVDGALDLAKEWSDEELAASDQGISVVASSDSSVFKKMQNLWDQRIASFRHPCINPAYRVTGGPGNWELTRRAGERYAKTYTWLDKVCLPNKCRVAARSLEAGGLRELQRADPGGFSALAKSLLVLDLPERFVSGIHAAREGNHPALSRAAV